VVRSDGLWLCAPTNTNGRLHSIKENINLYASNSLAFLCAAAGLDLAEDYVFYKEDLSSIIEGLNRAVRHVPMAGGHEVRLHYHCNVRIGRDLSLEEAPRRMPQVGGTFAQYRGLLGESLA